MIQQLTLEEVPWVAPEPGAYSHEERVLHSLRLQPRHQPISREGLTFWTFLSDRQVRLAIAALRDAGHCIVDAPGGGYRLGDREQAIKCAERLEARAKTELARARRMRDAASRAA